MPKAWQTTPPRTGMGHHCSGDRGYEQAILEAGLKASVLIPLMMMRQPCLTIHDVTMIFLRDD